MNIFCYFNLNLSLNKTNFHIFMVMKKYLIHFSFPTKIICILLLYLFASKLSIYFKIYTLLIDITKTSNVGRSNLQCLLTKI